MARCSCLTGACGVVAMLGLWIGCDRQREEPQKLDLAALPYLRETHHAELRDELARLLAEQATPQLLEESAYGRPSNGSSAAGVESALRELNEILDPQALRLTLQRLSRFYPQDGLRMNGIDMQKGRELRERYSRQSEGYRAALGRDDYQFRISLSAGLLADLTILDHARLAHRLEGLQAAEFLATGTPESVLLPLRSMLRIDARLALVKHVTARLTAGRLRAEALQVVAALVEQQRCTRVMQRELRTILESQLELWPPDADAWLGDRALGLHAYEMVRSGQLLSILTQEEIEGLKKDGNLQSFADAVMLSLDDDEWFYLSTMRRVIDGCRKPYYERVSTLEAIPDQLAAVQNTPRYPLFAAHVLLVNLAAGQREQALDRARCEAWVIALKEVTGDPVDPMWINPLTGKPYELLRDDEKIEIRGGDGSDGEKPICVPLRPRSDASS